MLTYVIILYSILKGGVFINITKTLTKDTKFYICKYGIFYEGQVLEQFAGIGEHKNYIQDVILEKFIIHFKAGQNYTLHFRMANFSTKEKMYYQLNC